MKQIIHQIFEHELAEKLHSIEEIKDLGFVNHVFDVKGNKTDYIIRLNENLNKQLEYQKEKWCLEHVTDLDIYAPNVLKIGVFEDMPFMIESKLIGKNGKLCTAKQKEDIWKKLGNYAKEFHQIKRIEDEAVEANEFHKDWKARLEYNIHQLNDNDSLLKNGVFNKKEHQKVKDNLLYLKEKEFQTGLVHGDLCPRNTIWNEGEVWLLDWGTAEINVVPHNEIGTVMMANEASNEDLQAFVHGLGITPAEYERIEPEIRSLNLLHRLDKYRWAMDFCVENIKDYEVQLRLTLAYL